MNADNNVSEEMFNTRRRAKPMASIHTNNEWKTQIKTNKTRSKSFVWANPVDYNEQEKKDEKTLFLCIMLMNRDRIVIRIGKKSTVRFVIATALRKIQVRIMYPNAKPDNFELILAASKTAEPLPGYYQIYTLCKIGFWTKPDCYSQYPLLVLQKKSEAPSKILKIPELLTGYNDPLIGNNSDWCSHSDEVSAFRAKYTENPAFKEISSKNALGKYPQFIDTAYDAKIYSKKMMISVSYPGHPLSNTIIELNHTMKLECLLEELQQKYFQLQKVSIDINSLILKFKGTNEYIYDRNVRMYDIDGIREASQKNTIPELELKVKPDDLSYDEISIESPPTPTFSSSTNCEDELRKEEISEKEIKQVLDKSQFQRRALTFQIMGNKSPGVKEAKRPQTLPVARIARKEKRFSILQTLSATQNRALEPLNAIDVRHLHTKFRVKILGIQNLKMYSLDEESQLPLVRLHPTCIRIEASLYTGCSPLDSEMIVTPIGLSCKDINHHFNENIRWGEWSYFSLSYSQLPLATCIKFVVKCWVALKEGKGPKECILGWVNFRIFGYNRGLQTGIHRLGLFPYYSVADPTGSTIQNKDSDASQLFIELDHFVVPVVFGEDSDSVFCLEDFLADQQLGIHPSDENELFRIMQESPLYKMSEAEKELVWKYRAYLSRNKNALPKLLLSVKWCDPQAVRDVYHILDLCEKPDSVIAMELLDGKYADSKLREFAVNALERLNNSELHQILIQLVQALKFEAFHDSALSRFLLSRALKCPESIGHTFFWLLRSEMSDPYYKERFGLLLEQYLRKCGGHRNSLIWENHLIKSLEQIAWYVQSSQCKREEVLVYLQDQLSMLNHELPEFYSIPYNSKIIVKKIKYEDCKFMKSKKKPLYIVFENADPLNDNYHLLFKVGDDLRQDMLTLQVLRVMENLWLKEGLDLGMSLYTTLALGNNVGIMEVVRNSETLAGIQKCIGGNIGALYEKILFQWLKVHDYPGFQDNFIKSCAGYCVATYVLGIADRHNDNIMVRNTGHFFHIDFGHFLGHFKKKLGIKRETAPFAFTPDMRYAMGGKKSPGFESFKKKCVHAYNILRKNKNLLISLFSLMLCSGIQELSRKDLEYLNKTLVGVSDDKAEKLFRNLIKKSLNDPMTRINFSIHILAN